LTLPPAITQTLKNLSTRPGVYMMRNQYGKILYIGKAKNLKKRVSSYFNKQHDDEKTKRLIPQIAKIDVTITPTEKEALLLENNLIKVHKPRYNVCLKDDKSYPYLVLSGDTYPRLFATRAAPKKTDKRFGPYPSMGSVRETLALLQKIFRIRQCTNSFFSNRSRPCLQYQIKRCSAPCVNYISEQDYHQDSQNLTLFLSGKQQDVLKKLAKNMQAASDALDFETAANYRDQLSKLSQLQSSQLIHTTPNTNIDIVAIAEKENQFTVQVLMIRQGQLLGSRTYHPRVSFEESTQAVLSAFLAQYYTGQLGAANLPHEILINHSLKDIPLLGTALLEKYGRTPVFKTQLRGKRRQWMDMAELNANAALTTELSMNKNYSEKLDALQSQFGLRHRARHMECFDISHTFGESPVASCVVFDHQGPAKKSYRQFNIKDITPGDDYAAIAAAVKRRYIRLKKEDKPLPDIIFIDGGKGQLSSAMEMLKECQLDNILVIAVAKGPERKAGLEVLWSNKDQLPISLDENSKALHLIQQVRDEAHRFAIRAHRKQRDKKRLTSPIDRIPGIGKTKKAALLHHFGGWQEIHHASTEELTKVRGINTKLAQLIHETLQNLD